MAKKNTGGRPRKVIKREIAVVAYLNEAEHARLVEAAERQGIPISQLVRSAVASSIVDTGQQ